MGSKDRCAPIIFDAVEDFMKNELGISSDLNQIRLTNFDTITYEIFKDELTKRLSSKPDQQSFER